MGYEGRRYDLYGALPGKTGVQDVMRSHPNLVLTGRRSLFIDDADGRFLK
jgi:hypothetical protein